ncbi:MAG: insulinase family protein [Marinobacter sp.]|uniref:insulinase family protein n=1 Tax=Marinobacter sp. TaxID=50741 RepID=UPI00299E17DB|nr:insulinase family protein [Marinobacter sp.]MDX1633599.1 insulinase family protein [Marinobacter sp.]
MRFTPSPTESARKRLSFVLLILLTALAPLANAAVTPLKSPNDDNRYRYLTLDNGLEVLLVSDPDSDKAAASLNVSVGSGDDPADRAGMAHFLEHMLFLGTEKYPEPGEYQQFIKSHGGSHNAFTAFQDTNYFFDIQASFLEPALDRFAQQFSAPLFTPALVERERRAVHSEFSSGLRDDGRRIYAAKKAAANPEHAFSKFSVGNITTLEDTETNPLRPDLLEFWRNHYSANIMHLAVYGPQSLDELEAMVRPRFTEIENRKLEPMVHDQPIYRPGSLPSRLEVEALKDLRRLTLTFPIPSQREHYRSKPGHYVSNLLGHEGPGSLFDVLRREGLVESLSAGSGLETGSHSTLELSMTLTPEGLEHQDRVTSLAFDYIDKVRDQGISERRFEEMQRLAQIDFRFRETPTPIQQVMQLSMQMQHVAPEDVLRAPYLMERFAPELYREILAELRPDNALVTVVAPRKPDGEVQKTRWYRTVYKVEPTTAQALRQPDLPKLAAELALPDANPFIPEELEMVAGETMAAPKELAPLPRDLDGLELWYARDTRFDTPKANVYLSLRSPLPLASARNHVLVQLLVDAINTNLNAWAYPARLAGLDYAVYPHLRGVTIRVGGYSDKLHTLFSRILAQVADPMLDQQRFEIARNQLVESLLNQAKERPVEQASNFLQSALIQGTWTTDEKLAAARDVSLEELKAFSGRFLDQLDPVMLTHGNLTLASALNLSRLTRAVVLEDTEMVTVNRSGVRDLPAGETEVSLQVEHPDTGYLLYLQGSNTEMETRARYRLLGQIVSSPFYEEIRTTRQLGYVVYATPYEMLETPALGFVIQSPEATGPALDQAVREFSGQFRQTLTGLTDAELEREKQAVVSRLLEQDRTLSEVSERYWREIDRNQTGFNSRELLADAVQRTGLDQLQALYESAVMERNQALRIITSPEPGNAEQKMEMLRDQPPVD